MKKISMKSGFTMIELIFVIVIIGILAAVALPKFAGMAGQAHVSNLGQYESSLTKTVAPTAWAKVVVSDEGNLSGLPADEQNLSVYADIPKEFSGNNGNTDANLSDTGTTDSDASGQKDVLGNDITCKSGKKPYELKKVDGTRFEASIDNKTYDVAVCNGTQTTSPQFFIYRKK